MVQTNHNIANLNSSSFTFISSDEQEVMVMIAVVKTLMMVVVMKARCVTNNLTCLTANILAAGCSSGAPVIAVSC